ncbi:MAG: RelA/SpoT AH/RIS domain-containing protein [Gemmatimonadota bacterium]|nr:RelA/SpoT AH/RIS domain-containing protein [Gemmatimonadota bacterium]
MKTSAARQRVRQWIRAEEHEQSVKLGKEFLDREIKKLRVSLPDSSALERAAQELDYPDWEHVHAALGRGDIGPSAVLKEVFPEEEVNEARRARATPARQHRRARSGGPTRGCGSRASTTLWSGIPSAASRCRGMT